MSDTQRTSEERACACVSSDAKECISRRYNHALDAWDDEYVASDERCECCCHDRYEDDCDDY
jgi:hypothetical protein